MRKNFTFSGFWCLLFILGIQQVVQSQSVKVSWGPVLQEPKKSFTSKIIGSDQQGFYSLRSKPSDKAMFLERYDLKNNLQFSRELIIPIPSSVKNAKFKFEGIYYLDGQLILFSSSLNEKTDINVAFANRISPEGVVDNKLMEVGTIENVTRFKQGDFSFLVSKDSTKILAFAQLASKANENQRIEYKVLDNKLNIVADRSITIPELSKNFEIINFTVDNAANVFVLASTFIKQERSNPTQQPFLYKVMGFYADKTFKEFEIKMPGKFITNIKVEADSKNDLMVAGFYGDTHKSGPGSVFYLKIDGSTQKFVAQGVKKLTSDVLELFMSKNKASRDNAGISGLTIKDLIQKPDGGALLVAEQTWVVVSGGGYSGGAYTPPTYHYYSNEILFVSIAAAGTIEWVTCIPKQQHTKDDGGVYNSYSLNMVGDKIYMIYNDDLDNIQYTDPRKLETMKNPAKAVTMLVTLDKAGKFKRTVLFPAKEQKTIVRPTYYTKGNDGLIIYSEVGRDYRYGNIRIN